MIENPDSPTVPCHHCGSSDLEVAAHFAAWHRVTSDCKPWPSGGGLARCRACGLVQTPVTRAWQAEAEEIYRSYTIYHQSAGSEQQVFDPRRGSGRPRSEQIVEALRKEVPLPAAGRLLDVGCGNGSFLSAWSRFVPGWSLVGTEVGDKYRSRIEAIAGVERLYTGDLEEIPGLFDLVSLVHVLEHVPAPAAFLARLAKRLKPGGLVMVEVPDCARNPFMLLVADHCSHFNAGLLGGVLSASGFQEVSSGRGWVPKEVSATARRPAADPRPTTARLPQEDSDAVFLGSTVLEGIVRKVEAVKDQPNFGLFGTAIAATWLDAQTNGVAAFFVDEDPGRRGRRHLNRPILAPAQVPPGATVFVALPEPLAGEVAIRLRALDLGLHVIVP